MDGLFTDGLPVALGSFRVAVDAFAFGFAFVLVAFFVVVFVGFFVTFFAMIISPLFSAAVYLKILCRTY
jgi:hypothetical protein